MDFESLLLKVQQAEDAVKVTETSGLCALAAAEREQAIAFLSLAGSALAKAALYQAKAIDDMNPRGW